MGDRLVVCMKTRLHGDKYNHNREYSPVNVGNVHFKGFIDILPVVVSALCYIENSFLHGDNNPDAQSYKKSKMSTGGVEKVVYSLVKNVGTLTLEETNERPDYISIVICQNKIIVLDSDDDNYKGNVKIYGLHDGKFLNKLDSHSRPSAICLMDATTICVLHDDGLIEMVSIKSENVSPVFTRMKSFRLHGVFDRYRRVVRVNDNIVVVGVKPDTTYWCIASLDDGHVDTIHQICKRSVRTDVTTKDNIIYISCHAGVFDHDNGVYRFDILNPSQCKYKYKHHRLHCPRSIVVNEEGNIFVGNNDVGFGGSFSIHQLTASYQLVAIFTLGIPWYLNAMFWDNGRLYVTCYGTRDITVFRHVYQEGSHKHSEFLMNHEKKQPIIVETSKVIKQGSVDNGLSSVETEMPASGLSPEDSSEDEKQENHTHSEVPISNEGKELVIKGTSAQAGQEFVDNGQSSVDTERPSSIPSPENSEDDTQIAGNHTDLEVPISDEGKQPVIEVTSTQIGQEIPIEQSVEEELSQAGIKMSTEERDLFMKFQKEIGTDIYFSNGPHRLLDGQETLKATETFIEQSRPDMKDKWLEYKSQGKLTPELIDVIYAKERNPELHDKKDEILGQMEDLNIIVKARLFDENGVKEDNYFFAPCILRLESQGEDVAPEQDPRMLSTSVLCWVFTGPFVPSSIFERLLAACIARWPVAKKKDTSKHRISHGSTVFELDLTHRLTLNCENNAILARITWSVLDNIKTPDAKLCTRVRMFISRMIAKITNSLKQYFQYNLCLQIQESQDVSKDNMVCFAPYQIWFEDEIHDPDSPIMPEHMNHARLCIALVTVCGKALREMLLDNFPVPYRDIYQAILANQARLIGVWGRPLLNQEQVNLVFIDPLGQQTETVDRFDLSLLYTLIRNVSTVQAPITGWGIDPQPSDISLGASVERIRSYRNRISGHSPDAKVNHQDFKDYWKKFEDVLNDIETVINIKEYSKELERQNRQVISIFDAC